MLGATAAHGGAAGTTPRALDGIPHDPQAPHLTTAATKAKKTAGFNCGVSCASYETTINQYFTDVAHDDGTTSNVYSVATQYYDEDSGTHNVTYGSTFGGSLVDSNPYPTSVCPVVAEETNCLTDSQLQTELQNDITANHWPTASTDLYFIFTPSGVDICWDSAGTTCATNTFCAYHHSTSEGNVIYAVEPDDLTIPTGGCDSGEAPIGNGADATINTISHEQNESISDPFGTGWWANDTDGDEMADLCAWDFGTPLGGTPGSGDQDGTAYNQVINGHDYFLQLEYSNAGGGCVPNLGGTVTPPEPDLQDGTGPLVFQDGQGAAVMLSNTVYAIYWIPAPPLNRTLPAIAGTAKVGKTLSTSHGIWTGFPTKYAYQWFRCSSSGTSCRSIAKATRSSYKLVKAAAKHKLYVRVTATNTAGGATANSALTRAVKA